MRIGILTHHFIANFGAFLQAYALQETIKREFPDAEVFVINYIHLKHCIVNNAGWFRYYLGRESFSAWWQKIHLPFTFFHARQKYLNLTKRCYSANDVNSLKLDVIVVGSDEVWNFRDSKSDAKIKFGEGLDCKHLISYAPSVGNSVFDANTPNYVIDGLKKFKSISVRDQLGCKLVEKITGKQPQIVLDPTFLVDFPIEKANVKHKDYILFYYAEHLPSHIKKQIIEYAKQHQLAIYGAGECDKEYTETTVNLTPFQWVDMFRNATFVITGTFHGVAFSIENRKQFKVYVTQKNRIKKVNDLLGRLRIANRSICDDFIFDLEAMSHEINYADVDKRINSLRGSSIGYLKQAIEDDKIV